MLKKMFGAMTQKERPQKSLEDPSNLIETTGTDTVLSPSTKVRVTMSAIFDRISNTPNGNELSNTSVKDSLFKSASEPNG